MTQLINEVKRMQQLAGILKEGQLNEDIDNEVKTKILQYFNSKPEEAKTFEEYALKGGVKGAMVPMSPKDIFIKLISNGKVTINKEGTEEEAKSGKLKVGEYNSITDFFKGIGYQQPQQESQLNEEGMTLPIKDFLKMGEDEFKVNFVKFTNNSAGNKGFGGTRNDGSFPVSVETDIKGKGPDGKFVINAYVTKEGNLDHIFLPGYDNSETLVKQVKDWGALRNYITSELAKTKPASEPQAESIDQAVNEALRKFRKGK